MRKSEPRPQGSGHQAHMRNQRGFTLLEALVATAVLGASVAALLGLLSGSLRNAARMEAPERALLLGQSKLHELISAGVTEEDPSTSLRAGPSTSLPSAPLRTSRAGGDTSETHALPFDQTLEGRWDERFRWEARATRFRPAPSAAEGSSPEPTPGEIVLARITLAVFWKRETDREEQTLSFETYQLRREPAANRE